nr:ferrochelatase [Shewanella marina]
MLLVNLGTPEAPTPLAVKRFLKQFLSDPRVVDLSPWLWWPILNGVVLTTRPKKVAQLYQSIWWPDGSPLMVVSGRQQQKLAEDLFAVYDKTIPVELGMTYGSPSLMDGVAKLRKQGVDRIVVLPLYPQYSCSTVAPVIDSLYSGFALLRDVPEVRVNKEYYQNPLYIKALATSVRKHWQQYGQAQKLLMSFHGVPKRYVEQGDPYYSQCKQTAKLLAAELGLAREQWQLCFQSRFGKEPWLTPYTDELLTSLPNDNITHVDVICPAFAADCLETLEEISVTAKASFLKAGGKHYHFIPCLNDNDVHIELLCQLVQNQAKGW